MDKPVLVSPSESQNERNTQAANQSADDRSPAGKTSQAGVWGHLNSILCQSFSPKVSNIILNSVRESTRKQYGHYLNEFLKYHDESTFVIDVNKLLNYLESLYERRRI
jgi:hypothetical protein